MAARVTVERILRDDDDAGGQSIREWTIEGEGGFITVKLKHGTGFLLIRSADIDIFAADLRRARDAAASLSAENPST